MKTNEEKLSDFMYKILESIHNSTASHRTDLPTKNNQSLYYIFDATNDEEGLSDILYFSAVYPFLEIQEINQNTIDKWEPWEITKPVPFKLVNKDFQDIQYSYEIINDNEYTIMNFKFGGRNFSLPIERIEKSYVGYWYSKNRKRFSRSIRWT